MQRPAIRIVEFLHVYRDKPDFVNERTLFLTVDRAKEYATMRWSALDWKEITNKDGEIGGFWAKLNDNEILKIYYHDVF